MGIDVVYRERTGKAGRHPGGKRHRRWNYGSVIR